MATTTPRRSFISRVLPSVEGLSRPEVAIARLVHDDRVRPADVGQGAELELPRRPHERRVVHPHEDDRPHAPLGGLHPGRPLVEPHRPLDPLHSPHAIEVVVREGLDLVDEAEARVHHPDLRVAHVLDLAGRAPHDVAEDRGLVGHQHRGDADREDQADVLAAVPGQHLHRHERHPERPPVRPTRARPRPHSGAQSTGRRRMPRSPWTADGSPSRWNPNSSPVPRRKISLARALEVRG